MKKQYTVQVDGHTFTRKSANGYTHCVIAMHSIEQYTARSVAEVVDGQHDADRTASMIASRKARIDALPKSSDGTCFYAVQGWTSRPDLAAKLAAKSFTHVPALVLEAK